MKLKILFAFNFLLLGTILSLLFLLPHVYTYILLLFGFLFTGFNPSGFQQILYFILSNILFFGPIFLFAYIGYKVGEQKYIKNMNKDNLDLIEIKYFIFTMLFLAVAFVIVFINISDNGFIIW